MIINTVQLMSRRSESIGRCYAIGGRSAFSRVNWYRACLFVERTGTPAVAADFFRTATNKTDEHVGVALKAAVEANGSATLGVKVTVRAGGPVRPA